MAENYTLLPEILEEVLLEEEILGGWALLLFNDDHNTFEWVIECLMKYCNHDHIQAEQCAWIVHTKGKCNVKNGSAEELEPICSALCLAGLSAKLEQN